MTDTYNESDVTYANSRVTYNGEPDDTAGTGTPPRAAAAAPPPKVTTALPPPRPAS